MRKIGTIDLEGMEFFAYHGCLEQEKINGNTFIVDFRCALEILESAGNDNLDNTINYTKIYEIVRKEMEKPSNLLENVAGRIIRTAELEIPEIIGMRVRVSKKNPPVGGDCKWARITVYGGSQEYL